MKCCFCEREGTRGFTVIPASWTPQRIGGPVGPFVQCTARKACNRRQDARYGPKVALVE